MPLVVKINKEWYPSENTALEVGGVVDVTDTAKLIADGTVKLYEAPKKVIKKEVKKKGGK